MLTPHRPHRLRVTGGRIVTPDHLLLQHDLLIDGARIAALIPSDTPHDPSVERVDAEGALVMPGMIDVHADYIERMAAPRPTSIMDLRFALRQAERELIAHGITTMFHSLALYAVDAFSPSPIRAMTYTRALIDLIDTSHHEEHLIRHRCHARFEIDNLERVDELAGYLEAGKIHLLSFMDHTPGQGQYRDLEVFRRTLKAYRHLSDEEVEKIMAEARSRQKLDREAMRALTALAASRGVAVASHDDDGVERIDEVALWGATISEFPITLEVARHARARGLHTVAGAPNVLLGGSHSGNLSAATAIQDGAIDVLASDYYPAGLLSAVFTLVRTHGVPLPAAVRLVTHGPAQAVLMADEIGALLPGRRADVLLVRELDDGTPVVARAFVDGVMVYASEYRR